MSTVKVRALIGKQWDPISWYGDLWEDCDEAGGIKPLYCGEALLPAVLSSPCPAEVTQKEVCHTPE